MIMKVRNTPIVCAMAAVTVFSSCASKKALVACQDENKSLMNMVQTTKEDLAAKNARVTSLEEQLAAQRAALAEQKSQYQALQKTLDQSLTNASQNNDRNSRERNSWNGLHEITWTS